MRSSLTLLETNKVVYTLSVEAHGLYFVGNHKLEVNTSMRNNQIYINKMFDNYSFSAWPTDSKLVSIYDLHMTTVWTKP